MNQEYQEIAVDLENKQKIIDLFHGIYYYGMYWDKKVWWRGFKLKKCIFDLWILQDLIWRLKPDVIIETGTDEGGSAMFFKDMMARYCPGLVITIDIEKAPKFPSTDHHYNYEGVILPIQGDSVSERVLDIVTHHLTITDKVMVLLDSDHSKSHVIKELESYNQFVDVGSYLIVEDTNLNGHPLEPLFGPGPWEAVHEWVPTQENFLIDTSIEVFPMTFNPRGYLLRVR